MVKVRKLRSTALSRFKRLASIGSASLVCLSLLTTSVAADPGAALIEPPTAGGKVRIRVPHDSPQTSAQLFLRNRSLVGSGGPWQSADSLGNAWDTWLLAGGGDVIELRRVDPHTRDHRVEIVGVVPRALDELPPECAPSAWSFHSRPLTATLELRTQHVLDASFPITVDVLGVDGVSLVNDIITAPASAQAEVRRWTVPVPAGTRVIVRLTDDFGNRSHHHWVSGQAATPPSSTEKFPVDYAPPQSQPRSERTANAAVVNSVGLFDGDFQATYDLLRLRGDRLDIEVSLHYRSHLGYRGPIGNAWDWVLDSRVAAGKDGRLVWIPGNGRVEEEVLLGGASPGLFLRFEIDATSQGYRVEAVDGTRYFFEPASGLIDRIERSGQSMRILRNSRGRVVALVDDKQRRCLFDWYATHDRLAAVRDFGGGSTTLDYDASGNLAAASRADGSRREWRYASGTPWITEVLESPAGGQPVLRLRNTYDAGGRVTQQRDEYCLVTSAAYGFSDLDPAIAMPTGASHVVRVTRPDGSKADYGLAAWPNATLVAMRQHHDETHRARPHYPGSKDPAWVEVCWEHDSLNLLVSATEYRHAGLAPDVTLERQRWSYLSKPSESPDSRLRYRMAKHERDLGTGSFVEVESREYEPTDSQPSCITRPGLASQHMTWSPDGQLVSLAQEAITTPTSVYAIQERYTHDHQGRVLAHWNANRLHDPSQLFPDPRPSLRVRYYERGYCAGWVSHREQLDRAGEVISWTEFEYDIYGQVAREIDNDGTNTSRRYDPHGRLVEETTLVQLTHPGAPAEPQSVTTVWTFGVGRDVCVYETQIDALGNVLDPNPVLVRQVLEDRSGQLLNVIESTAIVEHASEIEMSRRVAIFDTSGRVISDAVSHDDASAPVVHTRYSYDSAGRLLRRSQHPGHSADDELQHWYGYDHAGREIEHFAPGWTEPERSHYDAVGRIVEHITPKTALGFTRDLAGVPGDWVFGYFVTQNVYPDEDPGNRPAIINEFSVTGTQPDASDASTRRRLSTEFLHYDEAGRLVTRSILQPSGQWAETTIDRYPSGAVRQRWQPVDAKGTRHFHRFVLDDLDRIETIIDSTGNAVSVTRSPSGHIETEEELLVEENPSGALNLVTYRNEYRYDRQGNVIETRRGVGGSTPSHLTERRAYDGSGRLVRTEVSQGNAPPYVETLERDLAGRPVTVRYARLDGSPERRFEYLYDHRGLVVREGLPGLTETTHEYDNLGRRVRSVLPGRRTRTVEYGLLPASQGTSQWAFVCETSPEGVSLTRVSNELGATLTEVADWRPSPHRAGPRVVEFLYAEGGSCGCPARRSPVEIRTLQNPTALSPGDTIVRRAHDSAGRVTSESIFLRGAANWSQSTVEFGYDGQRTVLVAYPSGALLQRDLRPDGAVRALWWKRTPADDEKLISETYYLGRSPRVLLAVAESGDVLLRTDHGFDALHRVAGTTHSGPAEILAYELTPEFDVRGKAQQRLRSFGGPPVLDTFGYDSGSALADELWGDPARTHHRSHDAAGRLIHERSSRPERGLDHRYDSSGLLTAIDGFDGLHTERILACESSTNGTVACATYDRTRHNRRFTVDRDGNAVAETYDQTFAIHCNGAHVFVPRFEHTVTHSYQLDAWGRRVSDSRTGLATQFDLECPTGVILQTAVHDLGERTERRFFDGLGRLICLERSGPLDPALDAEDYPDLPPTGERYCFAYEGHRPVWARDDNGSRVEEYYYDDHAAPYRRGREIDSAIGLDQLFSRGLDPNGFPAATNLGNPADPTLGEGADFDLAFFNPIGVLMIDEGNRRPPMAPASPPTPASETLEEKLQLWDDDWFGDDLVAKFSWTSKWICDASGLRPLSDPMTNPQSLDPDVNASTEFRRPTPVGDDFELWHVGSGSRVEFNGSAAVGGAIAAGTVGAGSGVAVGSVGGPFGAAIGAGVGGLIGAVGGAIATGEASSRLQVATHKTLWKISCQEGTENYLITFTVLHGPSSLNAGELYWQRD